MPKNVVDVFASSARVGTLARSDIEPDTFLFDYASGCTDGNAVSLTMPVIRDQYDSMGTLHPIFEMNLPEGLLRAKLEQMFSKVAPDFDALSMLQIIGKSQIGRLRYSAAGTALEQVPTQSVDALLSYQGAEDLFNDLLDRFAQYSGISGMQPKVLIRAEVQPLARLTYQGATHIVKSFNPHEFHELAANEFFCMAASRHAGLPTANVQLSENRTMLVVERFDLRNGEYLGFEDFCVLSGMRAGGRYHSSYEALAERIEQYVSPEHYAESMAHYFGTVVLACVIRNGDAHLKNFGVLYDTPGAAVRLAPVYDMLSTKPYQPKDVLALALDGSKSYPTRKQLIQFGRQACKLSQGRVNTIMEQVVAGVTQAIADMKNYTEQHPDFENTAAHLRTAFDEGMESVTG